MRINRKEKIVQSAFQTLAKIPGASFDVIAEQAEISRATLYRYFSSRQELINEMCRVMDDDIFEKAHAVMKQSLSPEDKLFKILENLIPLGDHVRFLFHEPFISEDTTFNELYDKVKKEWIAIIGELQEEGLIRKDFPLIWTARTVDMHIFLAWDMVYNGEIAPKDAPKLVYQTLLDGLKEQSVT